MIQNRQVTQQEHERFVTEHNLRGGLLASAKTGENVIKTFYKAAGEAVGINLSTDELAVHDKALRAYIVKNDATEGRTAFADEIEAEDMRAENRKRNNESGNCCMIS